MEREFIDLARLSTSSDIQLLILEFFKSLNEKFKYQGIRREHEEKIGKLEKEL